MPRPADGVRLFDVPASDVSRRVGDLAQLARIDAFEFQEGPARGTRLTRMINGGGLELEVLPDRALDLGQVTVAGMPLAWRSPVGPTSPAFAEPDGTRWLRTFGGGLLATCGLDSFGPASRDRDVDFGLHGRIGAVPAQITRAEVTTTEAIVEGAVVQAGVFAEHLELHRRIATPLGSTELTVTDRITNRSYDDQPLMALYHINLGWPLIDEGIEVSIPSRSVTARDPVAEPGIRELHEFPAPTAGFGEQVYVHHVEPNQPVVVRNRRRRLQVEIASSVDSLPFVHQWKMAGEGHYVLGIEPTNCANIFGRAAARSAGVLPMLAPGATAVHEVTIRVAELANEANR